MEQLPTTAAGTLMLLASTQTQCDVFSDQLIESVKTGEVDPIKVLVQLRAMERISKRVIGEIMENCLSEAANYPEKSFTYYGNQVEKAPVHTEYDYTNCNDPEWIRLNIEFKLAKEAKDKRESFLKAMTRTETTLDKDSGEVIEIYPPNKKVTDGLKISIK